ncbi:hypothetical protein MOQ_007678 [Trypanosoma cruzi marinkellei]|uniref:CW-type domain-containing protein n=1 Tax=Trypanosoma cruzi marinkellei TaxID=85056 RepID=K2MN82_TRYCR|nr:hypothetical protein MOQ_007678 [Trypanosoma cruzi marinkellei]
MLLPPHTHTHVKFLCCCCCCFVVFGFLVLFEVKDACTAIKGSENKKKKRYEVFFSLPLPSLLQVWTVEEERRKEGWQVLVLTCTNSFLAHPFFLPFSLPFFFVVYFDFFFFFFSFVQVHEMAGGSVQAGLGPSTLWGHFVAVDITRTFCSLYAEKLSAVWDRREFSTRLAALMRQWRAEHWEDIFISAATRRGVNSDGVRRGRRRTDGDTADTAGNAVELQRCQRGVAMYYESIRVQRLMDEVLFIHDLEEERDELESDKIKKRVLRRRRGLIRTVDEVWRAGKKDAADFLLPVTEREAPLYYRRVRQPVCIASIYCSVWDAEVDDYAGLKALFTVMRSNCELYNGAGSPLVAACQGLVRVGFRAAREAQTDEEQEEVQNGGLVIPNSLLLETANGSAIGGGVGGDGRKPFPPLTKEELAWMFPPRYEALQSPVDGGRFNTAEVAGGRNENNADEPRRVLRLIRRSDTHGPDASGEGTAARTTTVRRLTLRRKMDAAPVVDAAAASSPSSNKEEGETKDDKKPKSRGGRKKKKPQAEKEAVGDDDDEQEVTYWIRCDLCDKWRIVPEKIEPLPEYWDCSFIGMKCGPLKRPREGEQSPKKEQKTQPGRKKKRDEEEALKEIRGKRGGKKKPQAEELALNDDSKEVGASTLPRARVSGRKKKKASRPAAPRKRRACRSPSSSSSSSFSSSDSTGSSSGSSSGSDSDSDSDSDSNNSEAPRRRGTGRKPRQKPQTIRGARRPRATKNLARDDDSDSDNSASRPSPAAKAKTPALTLEKLAELEEAMDEVDAMPLEDQNPKEILTRLRSIEKFLQ